jgi:hypothetical protein
VESGKWRVESGKLKVESGEWKVENGEWEVESGKFNKRTCIAISYFINPPSYLFLDVYKLLIMKHLYSQYTVHNSSFLLKLCKKISFIGV